MSGEIPIPAPWIAVHGDVGIPAAPVITPGPAFATITMPWPREDSKATGKVLYPIPITALYQRKIISLTVTFSSSNAAIKHWAIYLPGKNEPVAEGDGWYTKTFTVSLDRVRAEEVENLAYLVLLTAQFESNDGSIKLESCSWNAANGTELEQCVIMGMDSKEIFVRAW
ncbi:hypothetical protein BDZ91DRAFT_764727 [Kalaharituber pfeilii]|nr:hypothetical protein BDZ91DRAFT_764727 [Kalaharituber pfeilii]